MDRILKVYSKPGCLFAELSFSYDRPGQAGGKLTLYNAIEYDYGDGDVSYSVYPLYEQELHEPYRRFASIEEAQAYDRDLVRKQLGHEMKAELTYTYVYPEDPVLDRYVLENHLGCQGIFDIRYSFIGNTKTMSFRSGEHARKDWDVSAGALDSNIDCILQVPVPQYDGEIGHINYHDLRKLESYY
ncbi:MAG: hypothetical protein EOO12_06095 [Chitinophagaceae bacterium]|nr:MAG: hypothetical protein EOO12_06095 [Chitinophagaceae bacterium]